MATKYHNAHEVEKGDPKVDGPYLDDIRADQERAYRETRSGSKKKGPGQKALEKEEKVAKEQATSEDVSMRTDKGEIAKKLGN